jgi:hypothetical protein
MVRYSIAKGYDQCALHLQNYKGVNSKSGYYEEAENIYSHLGFEPPPYLIALQYKNYALATILFNQHKALNGRNTINDLFKLTPQETPGCIPNEMYYEFCDYETTNPLHWVAKNLEPAAVKWVLEMGADPNYVRHSETITGWFRLSAGEGRYILPAHYDLLKMACQTNNVDLGHLLYRYGAEGEPHQDCVNFPRWHAEIKDRQFAETTQTVAIATGLILVGIIAYRNRDVLFAWSRNCYIFFEAIMQEGCSANKIKNHFWQKKLESAIKSKNLSDVQRTLKKEAKFTDLNSEKKKQLGDIILENKNSEESAAIYTKVLRAGFFFYEIKPDEKDKLKAVVTSAVRERRQVIVNSLDRFISPVKNDCFRILLG